MSLERLFRPQSIAVIGGKEAENVIIQCKKIGFKGPIYSVHPHRETMVGCRCFSSVQDLPLVPDAVFIGVNRHLTVELVKALRVLGAGGVIAYASGFQESDDGAALHHDLLDAAGDMPFLGPNCYGLINALDGVALWPDQHGCRSVGRGVAMITQSSNVAINLSMQQRGLPVAYVVTTGNQAQQSIGHIVAAVASDPRVSAIGLHIEGISDLAAFEAGLDIARQQGLSVVAIKTGRSVMGSNLTLSHTASLAGSDDLVAAYLRRQGVVRVDTLSQLIESLMLLHVQGPLNSNTLASMSCSGGEAALMADAAQGHDVYFPVLDQQQHDRIKSTLSDLVTVTNPLDYHTFIWSDYERMKATYRSMLSLPFALVFLVLDYPREDDCDLSDWHLSAKAFADAARETGAKGAVVASLPENLTEQTAIGLIEQGIVPLRGIDDALVAAEVAYLSGLYQTQIPSSRPLLVDQKKPTVNQKSVLLDEWQSKKILQKANLMVPRGVYGDASIIKQASPDFAYPQVLKICNAQIAHKSDCGGVKLNLENPKQIEDALDALSGLSKHYLLEEQQEKPVAEVLVGMNTDPQFGLYLVLSAGGVYVELMQDAVSVLLPCTREEVITALSSLKIYHLLNGYRGAKAGDVNALIDFILNLAESIQTLKPQIKELDINPVFVFPQGDGVVAVDALITVGN